MKKIYLFISSILFLFICISSLNIKGAVIYIPDSDILGTVSKSGNQINNVFDISKMKNTQHTSISFYNDAKYGLTVSITNSYAANTFIKFKDFLPTVKSGDFIYLDWYSNSNHFNNGWYLVEAALYIYAKEKIKVTQIMLNSYLYIYGNGEGNAILQKVTCLNLTADKMEAKSPVEVQELLEGTFHPYMTALDYSFILANHIPTLPKDSEELFNYDLQENDLIYVEDIKRFYYYIDFFMSQTKGLELDIEYVPYKSEPYLLFKSSTSERLYDYYNNKLIPDGIYYLNDSYLTYVEQMESLYCLVNVYDPTDYYIFYYGFYSEVINLDYGGYISRLSSQRLFIYISGFNVEFSSFNLGFSYGYWFGYDDRYFYGFQKGYEEGRNDTEAVKSLWGILPDTVANIWNNTLMPFFQFDILGIKLLDIFIALFAIAFVYMILKFTRG